MIYADSPPTSPVWTARCPKPENRRRFPTDHLVHSGRTPVPFNGRSFHSASADPRRNPDPAPDQRPPTLRCGGLSRHRTTTRARAKNPRTTPPTHIRGFSRRQCPGGSQEPTVGIEPTTFSSGVSRAAYLLKCPLTPTDATRMTPVQSRSITAAERRRPLAHGALVEFWLTWRCRPSPPVGTTMDPGQPGASGHVGKPRPAVSWRRAINTIATTGTVSAAAAAFSVPNPLSATTPPASRPAMAPAKFIARSEKP